MPCSDGRDSEIEADTEHMYQGAELLCDYLRGLEESGSVVPVRYQRWWAEHKKRDEHDA